VVKVSEIATLYRQEFNSDIFIDMVCYRRHGHNEGDEPKFTQPQLYALIEKHLNPREVYTQYLIENGEPDAKALAKEMEQKFLSDLQERLDEVKQNPLPYTYQKPELWWQSLRRAKPEDFNSSPITAIKEAELKKLFDGLMKWPAEFKPLRKVEKLIQDKVKLYQDEQKIDWATAELLAYSSLLTEGKDVIANLGFDRVEDELKSLEQRRHLTSQAITMCTISALLVCLVVASLFIEVMFQVPLDWAIGFLFTFATIALIAGLVFFLGEVHKSARTIRIRHSKS